MRAGTRRLHAGLLAWAAVATGVVAVLSPSVRSPHFPSAPPARIQAAPRPAPPVASPAALAGPASGSRASHALPPASAAGTEEVGTYIPLAGNSAAVVPVARPTAITGIAVAPLRRLLAADLLVVSPSALPAKVIAAIRRLRGVTAAELLDAARIKVNGSYVAILGVNASNFRAFAARPTARSTALWQSVANGGIAVSYLMGKEERLPLGGTVLVAGRRTEGLRVGGFGTVGISGVNAVVSDQVARSLGMPAGNAIVISAPNARLSSLIRQIGPLLPRAASIAPLVSQAAVRGLPVSVGSAGGVGVTASDGPGLTAAQIRAFLVAALSRVGLPYVWGGSGPSVFDCSGLVQWSIRQAGIVMPRVAVDQARTGPLVPLAYLQPGDLLFYHTDPTAPTYISHVAIYLGNGEMLQAPEPGMDVEVVPAVFDGGFAGAVRIYPRVAAAVAGQLGG